MFFLIMVFATLLLSALASSSTTPASVVEGDLLFRLMNQARAEAGLHAFARDTTLDEIARGHAEDMRDHDLVEHHSATTGTLANRLGAAGYATSGHGENVARHTSIRGAHHALLDSPGHRRNLLEPGFTTVGVGVAATTTNGVRMWFVTQVFTRPVPRLGDEARRVLDAIGRRRQQLGLRPLREVADLVAVARESAAMVDIDPAAVLAELTRREFVAAHAYAGVFHLWDPEQLRLPAECMHADARRIGVGVVQTSEVESPSIHVVIIVAR